MRIEEILPEDMFPMAMTRAEDGSTFVVTWEDPLSVEIMWNRVKMVRQSMLAQSDWTQTQDSPVSEEMKEQWRIFRQQLRDIPQNFADPREVVFPIPPEGN